MLGTIAYQQNPLLVEPFSVPGTVLDIFYVKIFDPYKTLEHIIILPMRKLRHKEVTDMVRDRIETQSQAVWAEGDCFQPPIVEI